MSMAPPPHTAHKLTFVSEWEIIKSMNRTLTSSPLDLQDLECFLALAEHEHFGQAAERLGMSVSALSKRCAHLENALGIRLFDRTSRRVNLTQGGAGLVQPARRIIAEVEDFLEVAQETAAGRVGELVIGYSPGTGPLVSQIIRAVHGHYPDVHFRLVQVLSRDMAASVRGGRASIGVCRSVKARPRGLRSLVISRIPMDHVAMPADHRLAVLAEVTLEDMVGETLLASEITAKALRPESSAYLSAHGISIRVEPWVSESHVLDTVAAGVGLAFITSGFLGRNSRPDVVSRPCASSLTPEPLTSYLIWRPDDTSPIVHEFVAAAESLFPTGD